MSGKVFFATEVGNIALRVLVIVILVELAMETIEELLIPAFPLFGNPLLHSIFEVLIITPLLAWFVVIPVVQQRKNELIRTQNLALHDHLTGLPNRLLLIEHLNRSLSGNPRYNFSGALLYFDLDGFKIVNDTHGHDAGDSVLVTIGHRLKDAFRSEDIVSRVGGDEFVLQLQNLGSDQSNAKQEAFRIAQKIQNLVSIPIELMGHRFEIGCSVGICMLTDKQISPALAIREADIAMYKAKLQSSHKIIFADEIDLRSYGIATTCVPEIDLEHEELDALLEEAIASEANHGEYLRRVVHGVKRHFKNEERISREKSLDMSAAHMAKHRELSRKLSDLENITDQSKAIAELKAIQDILRDHVVTFDRELAIGVD